MGLFHFAPTLSAIVAMMTVAVAIARAMVVSWCAYDAPRATDDTAYGAADNGANGCADRAGRTAAVTRALLCAADDALRIG